MTELIVALDLRSALEARGLFNTLSRETGVRWFKVRRRVALSTGGWDLCRTISERANLFLDLKIYDTRDSVFDDARGAFEAGARLLTVHATPSMLEAAMAAKTSDEQKVLAVVQLTDVLAIDHDEGAYIAAIENADGAVCSVSMAQAMRAVFWPDRGKLLVCPGVRPLRASAPFSRDNHASAYAPAEARDAGADYIVVGRPIYRASDPVAAARAIMEELQ